MILNSKGNQFKILFPSNFLYPEIIERYTPIVQKLKTPYETVLDFLNASIQSVTFPRLELPVPEQTRGHLTIRHRSAKELTSIIERKLTITFKLGESYLAYWILFENIYLYLKLYDTKVPYWGDMFVSFLDNNGYELLMYKFRQIVPTSLSQLDLSYSSILADFKTFELSFYYNLFELKNTEYMGDQLIVTDAFIR